jgi:death-on-curing protein
LTDYLTTDEVILIHDAESDAPLADRNLLDSAVMVVQQGFAEHEMYPTLHLKAAALLRGVASNHPFVDGNKRCALVATRVMYARNNYVLAAPNLDFMHLVIDVTVEHWDVPKIAERLEMWAVPFGDLPDAP